MTPTTEQIQQAIKHFQSLQKRYTTQHNGRQCELVKTALSCMEKQVARPLRVIYPYGNSNEPETECAVCGNPYANDTYCGTCGQAIDHLHTESEE